MTNLIGFGGHNFLLLRITCSLGCCHFIVALVWALVTIVDLGVEGLASLEVLAWSTLDISLSEEIGLL